MSSKGFPDGTAEIALVKLQVVELVVITQLTLTLSILLLITLVKFCFDALPNTHLTFTFFDECIVVWTILYPSRRSLLSD